MNRERDWECKSRVKENETKWEKKKMRYECVRQTKRNETNLVPMNFLKRRLFRVHNKFFFRYLRKSIRSTMVSRLSIHLDGGRNHDSPGTDLTLANRKPVDGRYFLVINQGKRGGQRGPITSVQVFSRTKGGEKKERTWKVARNSEARPDASGFRK